MSQIAQQLDSFISRRRIPTATYRLQLNRQFTFAQAAAIADYLSELGIGDLYISPLFTASPGSTHGYDVCNFAEISSEIGSRSDFDALSRRLRELGLGLILDMVPNHMGSHASNCWWNDVLEHGSDSPFACFFDIDWRPPGRTASAQVLLPVLEDDYAKVLENGKLRLTFDSGNFFICYYESRFPVAQSSMLSVLENLCEYLGEASEAHSIREQIRRRIKEVCEQRVGTPAARAWSADFKEQLATWHRTSAAFREALCRSDREINGHPGNARSFDRLHTLLSQQYYRLASWRVGPEEINYRRFFDVTQLVSMRMELPEVFTASHALVFELLRTGQVSGLRIDHPDGLRDPREYFRRLQATFLSQDPATKAAGPSARTAADEWLNEQLNSLEQERAHWPVHSGMSHTLLAPRSDPLAGKRRRPHWPLWIIAEKILSGDEPLPADWPIDGTTGYEFLNVLNGLFVDSEKSSAFDALYVQFTGNQLGFRESVYQGKKHILESSLVSELRSLTERLRDLALRSRYSQDFTFRQLQTALAELIAAFPVYRTYIRSTSAEVAPVERAFIEEAVAEARKRAGRTSTAVLDLVQDLLLLRSPPDFSDHDRQLQREFVLRFQQLTGPVMAKGLEDTALYTFNRLLSLNEVGGDADRFGIGLEEFHRHNLMRAEQWPHSLLATATHDTKRGEDVRARLNVLSEIPEQWAAAIVRWSALNRDHKIRVAGEPAPDRNDEYLLYQTLVGAWPMAPDDDNDEDPNSFRARLTSYMTKALREAKRHTDWTDPNSAYEQATTSFVHTLLDPASSPAFLADFLEFQRHIAFLGRINSLSQVLLKATSPGVPDFYQGTELWDLSLVDPDNRRPVGYELRRRLLEEIKNRARHSDGLPALLRDLLEHSHTGQIKLYIAHRALDLRRQSRELFMDGSYLPLDSTGSRSKHVCAFARVLGAEAVITIAPRLVSGLTKGLDRLPVGQDLWEETVVKIPDQLQGHYLNVFTGNEMLVEKGAARPSLKLAAVLRILPLALLTRTSP